MRFGTKTITGKRIWMAVVVLAILVGSVQLPGNVRVAHAADLITYTGETVSTTYGGSDIGGTHGNPVALEDPTTVYYKTSYTADYVKIIKEMMGTGNVAVPQYTSKSFKIPMSDLTTVASSFVSVPISVSDGANPPNYTVEVGKLEYKSDGADGAGLYITYDIGTVGANVGDSTGLLGLFEKQTSVSANDLDSNYSTYAELKYSGHLEYTAELSKGSNAYDTELELTKASGGPDYVKFTDPNPLKAPTFTKTGAMSADGDQAIWTITIDRDNSPADYILTDILPAGSALLETGGISVKNDAALAAAFAYSSGTTDPTTGTLSANQAYYNTTSRSLTMNIHFEDTEDTKVFTVTTKITDGAAFLAAGTATTTGTSTDVKNTATLTNTVLSTTTQTADGTVTIPTGANLSTNSKTGVFDTTNGTITWVIKVTDVNTAWLEDLVIYDNVADDWMLDGSITVKATDASGTELTVKDTKIAKPGDSSTKITPTENTSITEITSGFKLTLFDGTDGSRANNYYITYVTKPVDSDYWKTNDAKDVKTSNAAWMRYSWKSGKGPVERQTPTGPSLTDFPINSAAVAKSKRTLDGKTTGYDPATGTFQWSVELNPHKIPMDITVPSSAPSGTAPVTLTDTLGTGMKLVGCDTPIGDFESTIDDAGIQAIFGSGTNAVVTALTYKCVSGAYSFTATINPDAVNGTTTTLQYKTKATDASKYAGNIPATSAINYKNEVNLDYFVSGSPKKATDDATDQLTSQVIDKTCLGYDYSSTSATAATIKWQVKVNQNKMVMSSSNHDTYITDLIDESQELVIGPGTPVTVTTDSVSAASTSWTSAGKTFTATSDAMTDGTVLKEKTAYNGETASDGKGAILHSINPPVEDQASWKIYNTMFEKRSISRANDAIPKVTYLVGINPMKMTMPNDFTIVDTLGAGLALDPSSIGVYESTTSNTNSTSNVNDRSKVDDVSPRPPI